MTLNEAQFHALVEQTQAALEDIFDATDLDIDVENTGGVLTIRFENGSQLIFSRQEPLKQLWVAARSGGFHFNYDADANTWRCVSNQETLGTNLTRLVSEQAGINLTFSELL